MKKIRGRYLLLAMFLSSSLTWLQAQRITIPLGGNTWSSAKDQSRGKITTNGIESWTSGAVVFTTYVHISKRGIIKGWLNLKVSDGQSTVSIAVAGNTKKINAEGMDTKDYYAGEWEISDTGYIAFQIKGISKTGETFADIMSLELEGTAINDLTTYVKNNEGNFFYWGRRGPSVHLNYTMPENTNAEWFYNEVTVPVGEDVMGSYFMADGFGEGYFGMQVNSSTERRILFSVWSPFKTDNPKEIPEGQKIQLLKKGEGVHAGEFGSEGSGGQSYLRYNWKAGTTFTTDNTGRKGYRMDYAGGVKGEQFYLRNCGFFNHYTLTGTWFERLLTRKRPVIDLKKLP